MAKKAATAASPTALQVEHDALHLLPPKFRDRASLTVDDVCEVISVGASGLYKQIDHGHWPAPLKAGKRSFWPTTFVASELKRRLDEAAARQRNRIEKREASATS